MGFKCQLYFKGFLMDNEAWRRHITDAHDGIGTDIVSVVETLNSDRIRQTQKCVDQTVDQSKKKGFEDNPQNPLIV